MNRYPVWKYVVLVFAVLVGLLYTVPNFFGEAPAVQIAAAKATVKVDASLVPVVQQLLDAAKIKADFVKFEGTTVRARFADTDTQIHAKDVIEAGLNSDKESPSYVVALNLLSRSPAWLEAFGARPMYLGLDLRGGVHFLMQVDMSAALTKKAESVAGDLRTQLREKKLHAGVTRDGNVVSVRVRDKDAATGVQNLLSDGFGDWQWTPADDGNGGTTWSGALKPAAQLAVQDQAIKQNMTTLGNRVAGLGTSEPVIQQQGPDRIVVELPGIQDTARAKEIIGRTATLEVHMVDDSAEAAQAAAGGLVPFGDLRFPNRDGGAIIVKRDVVISGDDLDDAQQNVDQQNQPIVRLWVNSRGAVIMRDTSRDNIGKRMAIVLIEHGKGEVVTAPVIRGELGAQFEISGAMSVQQANETALLLRAGALAAPMEFVEESAIGPSLGADNIKRGLDSVTWGFVAIMAFMCLYYLLFGLISTLSLAVNLLLLIAVLSLMQTTLTLPGVAAIALTLGMAIDANVLVNERIREELRNGSAPQSAISAGYERAWATILDSNITTLIAGLSLYAFGSGPIRAFAIVHCLGIMTSMFSAVFFSRGLVNLWYGSKKKLKSLAIGQVWKPGTPTADLPQPDEDDRGPGASPKARAAR